MCVNLGTTNGSAGRRSITVVFEHDRAHVVRLIGRTVAKVTIVARESVICGTLIASKRVAALHAKGACTMMTIERKLKLIVIDCD
jgi:hypothetical protein